MYWVLSSGIELVFQFQLLRFYLIPTGLWGELRRHLHGVATEFVFFFKKKRNILPSFFLLLSLLDRGRRPHARRSRDRFRGNERLRYRPSAHYRSLNPRHVLGSRVSFTVDLFASFFSFLFGFLLDLLFFVVVVVVVVVACWCAFHVTHTPKNK